MKTQIMKILNSAVLAATLGVFSLPALAMPMTGDSFDTVLTADIIDNCDSFACGGTSDGSGTFTLGAEITAGSLMGNFELSAYIFLINAVTYDSSVRLDFLSYNPSTGNIVGVADIPGGGFTFRRLTFNDSGEYTNQVNLAVVTRGHQSSMLITTGGDDADGDGVVDDDDLCPDTVADDPVDANGCSDAQVDGDGDGICTAGAPSGGPSSCTGTDNCPADPNNDQANQDGDLFGDACDDDVDGDGVANDDDFCPVTTIPEGVPWVQLRPNRWALIDDDVEFDTVIKGKGKGPGRNYSTSDTAGCSCEQIIELQGLGNGHTYHGCSISAMDEWVEIVTP